MPALPQGQDPQSRRVHHLLLFLAILTVYQAGRALRSYQLNRPQAIPLAAQRGIDWLLAQQKDDGSWEQAGQDPAELTAAGLLALLHAPNGGTRVLALRAGDFLLRQQEQAAEQNDHVRCALATLQQFYPQARYREFLKRSGKPSHTRHSIVQDPGHRSMAPPSSEAWFQVRKALIAKQNENGSWTRLSETVVNPVEATAFAILFLAPEDHRACGS